MHCGLPRVIQYLGKSSDRTVIFIIVNNRQILRILNRIKKALGK